MGEALDSLFAEGSGDIYRQNLISSLRQTQQNDGHLFYTKGDMGTSWGLNGNGTLYVGGRAITACRPTAICLRVRPTT